HTDLLRTIAFSLDGTRVAAAGADGTARVWDPATGRELLAFSAHSEMVTGVVFSPDGERLATSGWDGLAKLWDSTSGEEILTLYGDGARLHSLAFTPDGYYVATAGDTGVRVYVLRVGELIALARSRLTRSLTTAECQTYLQVDECLAIGE
ncbi:MAG TPA: hypothetical protein VER55_13415, partial [Ardenticatenaceae bacterium]|nr:hypothetical protein [Ardenticatenaceae bacterium]